MVKLNLNRSSSSSSFIDIQVLSFDECEERIRKLFDKALLVFLEEEGSYRTRRWRKSNYNYHFLQEKPTKLYQTTSLSSLHIHQ